MYAPRPPGLIDEHRDQAFLRQNNRAFAVRDVDWNVPTYLERPGCPPMPLLAVTVVIRYCLDEVYFLLRLYCIFIACIVIA